MKKALHARGVSVGLALACIVVFLRPARAQDDLSYFDWRHRNGKDYTTPIRNQLGAGTCWAFAAVASLESKLEICYDLPDWNPDLSEQHLVCDGTAGDASRGWESKALKFFMDTVDTVGGIVTEAELPYTASNESDYWPLAEGWEDRVYSITGYTQLDDISTDNVKLVLRTHGPLTASMYSGTSMEDSDWIPTPDSAPPTSAVAWDEPTGGVNHSVSVIGYMDDETILNGGYWIIKNSWGTEYGDNGYYYIPYGVLESHDRIYAITGEAIAPVPEPASMILLPAGFVLLLKRRNS